MPEKLKRRYLDPPPRPIFPFELMFRLIGDVRGKRVLCCGCGDDNAAVLLAMKGAEVWAFDLSEEAMFSQRRLAQANRVEDRLRLFVSAIEELPLQSGYFDAVFGSAILHHVPNSLPMVCGEVFRVLKPNGFAVFTEPFANSAFLRWLREIIPVPLHISPSERQLTTEDLRILERHFAVELFPFCLTSRLCRLFSKGPVEDAPAWRHAGVYSLHALGGLLLRFPPLRRYAGVFVLKLAPRALPKISNVEGHSPL